MQEILVLAAVALALFALPRMMGKGPAPEPVRVAHRRPALTGRMRLAILITLFWVLGAAALLEPWRGDVQTYLVAGLAPPAVLWGGVWVWFGYRKYRR
ncbi:MAG: hypothetical protein ACYC7J_11220 [Syntrophales bacterium]